MLTAALPRPRLSTRSSRAARALAVWVFVACGVYVAGCSSAAPSAAPSGVEGTLSGTYFSLTGGDTSEITFEDETHYTTLKSGCAGEQIDGAGDVGCTGSGTYSLDTASGLLSLTDDATGTTSTIPFEAQSTEVAADIDVLSGTTSLGGKSTSLTSGTGATLSSKSAPLISCFGAALTEGDPTSRTYGLHCPSSKQISRDGIIARAQLWVNARLPYCQSANNASDGDKQCAHTCKRPGEPKAWDAYRSDCSGLVSWAWGLPAPGRTTGQFGDVSISIAGNDLEPGDALDRSGVHIILFEGWTDSTHTSANFVEEPGCAASPSYAHSFTSTVKITGSSVYVTHNRESFKAIRFNKLCASTCGGTAETGVVGSTPGLASAPEEDEPIEP